MKLLTLLYTALLVDLLTGQTLNLYGFGREPLAFALGAVLVAFAWYRAARTRLGMIALVLCAAWLLLYPAKNGVDVVLSPLLVLGATRWLWRKIWCKRIKNED